MQNHLKQSKPLIPIKIIRNEPKSSSNHSTPSKLIESVQKGTKPPQTIQIYSKPSEPIKNKQTQCEPVDSIANSIEIGRIHLQT